MSLFKAVRFVAATTSILAMSLISLSWADGSMPGHGHGMGIDDAHRMHDGEQKMPMMESREVHGNGVVNKIWMENHMINVSHEPMPELSWPKMRMNFPVAEDVSLEGLKPGAQIRFLLQVDAENNYLVKDIQIQP